MRNFAFYNIENPSPLTIKDREWWSATGITFPYQNGSAILFDWTPLIISIISAMYHFAVKLSFSFL